MDDPKMRACSPPQPFIMVSQDGWNYGVAAGIITLILCLLLIRLEARKRRNLPPSPPGWPIIGNLLQLGNKPHESLFVLSQRYGPLMSLRLGMRTTIVVSSPAMAKEVLKKQDHVFAGRTVPHVHDALHQSKASLVFAQQGPYWRMLRRISNTNLFTAKKLDSLQSLRKQKVDDIIGDVLNSWRKNKPVDFGRSVLSCLVNLLGNMIFGKDMFDPGSPELKRFKEATWEAVLVHGTPISPISSRFFGRWIRRVCTAGPSRPIRSCTQFWIALLRTVLKLWVPKRRKEMTCLLRFWRPVTANMISSRFELILWTCLLQELKRVLRQWNGRWRG